MHFFKLLLIKLVAFFILAAILYGLRVIAFYFKNKVLEWTGLKENRIVQLNVTLAKLAGIISNADGAITTQEILAFKQYFGIDDSNLDGASTYFNQASSSSDDPSQLAQDVFQLLNGNSKALRQIAFGFMRIVFADGIFDQSERKIMETILNGFRFSSDESKYIFFIFEEAFRLEDENLTEIQEKEHYLKILGLSLDVTFSEIKKAHRALSKIHHPDVLIARGISPVIISESEEALKIINTAYDWLSKRYKREL